MPSGYIERSAMSSLFYTLSLRLLLSSFLFLFASGKSENKCRPNLGFSGRLYFLPANTYTCTYISVEESCLFVGLGYHESYASGRRPGVPHTLPDQIRCRVHKKAATT